MIEPHVDRPQAITLGADRAYEAEDFVNELRSMKVTSRHAGYAVSQRVRKRIEQAFGWIKMVGGLERTKFRGCDRVGWAFVFAILRIALATPISPLLMAQRLELTGR